MSVNLCEGSIGLVSNLEVVQVSSILRNTSWCNPVLNCIASTFIATSWTFNVHVKQMGRLDFFLNSHKLFFLVGHKIVKETSFFKDRIENHTDESVVLHVTLGDFVKHLLPLDPLDLAFSISFNKVELKLNLSVGLTKHNHVVDIICTGVLKRIDGICFYSD